MSLLDNVYDTESRMSRKTALQIPGRNIYWKYMVDFATRKKEMTGRLKAACPQ